MNGLLPSIDIRTARRADIPAIQNLLAQVDRLHWESQPDVFQETQGPAREDAYLRGLITDWQTVVTVAEVGADLVGCLIARIQQTPEVAMLVPQQYLMVDTLVVDEASRSCGVGNLLMAHIETWAQARDIHRVELNVFEFNALAQGFYEDLDYTTLSRRMVKQLGEE